MKRAAQPVLSIKGQQAFDQYKYALKQVEDLSLVTICNYLSDFRHFIAWCEKQDEQQSFTPQAISPPLLILYQTYLQIILWLKPSSINRALMSLKRYFAWVAKIRIIQQDPTSTIKFVPKAAAHRHRDDDEVDALIAVVNAIGTLRDWTMITLLLHTGLQARELCTLTCQQVYIGKRNGMLRVIGKRRKERDILFNATMRSILSAYLETLPRENLYPFPSEKTQEALTERTFGHLITKYARLAHLVDVGSYDLQHCFGYRMAQIMGHNSLDTTMLYIRGMKQNQQHDVEKIVWI